MSSISNIPNPISNEGNKNETSPPQAGNNEPVLKRKATSGLKVNTINMVSHVVTQPEKGDINASQQKGTNQGTRKHGMLRNR